MNGKKITAWIGGFIVFFVILAIYKPFMPKEGQPGGPPVGSSVQIGWFEPADFPSCVEKYVKGLKSNRAAQIINYTCRMQFDQNKQSVEWQTYFSCVRKNLEGVEKDDAASILVRSCQEKYRSLFAVDQYGAFRPID